MPYMPPELLAQSQLTPKADVYSFGIVMWELLSGQVRQHTSHVALAFCTASYQSQQGAVLRLGCAREVSSGMLECHAGLVLLFSLFRAAHGWAIVYLAARLLLTECFVPCNFWEAAVGSYTNCEQALSYWMRCGGPGSLMACGFLTEA